MPNLRESSASASTLSTWEQEFKFRTHNDPALIDALTVSARFCRNYTLGKGPFLLSLIGFSGTGKTHLAKQIWRRCEIGPLAEGWLQTEYCKKVIHWPGFISEVKGTQNYEVLRDIQTWPMLVIDEAFGDKDPTGFSTSELVQLISRREFKHTIITSNLRIDDIAAIETRISSRMARNGAVFAELNCKDYSLRSI